MRKLASICVIETVDHIENSDFLDVVTLRGKLWRVVVKRDSVRVGDYVVYFEIDSALPVDDERYDFLKERCLKKLGKYGNTSKEVIRIQTQKLRGVVSQGLVLEASLFPELADDLSEGRDVTELLRVEHYDELREKCRPITIGGQQAGLFPIWLEKSDEERIQNMAELFTVPLYKKMRFEVTEKYDGCSATYFFVDSDYRKEDQSQFGVCSRNFELSDTDGNVYWVIAKRFGIEEKLRKFFDDTGIHLAIQGEIVGPNINKNRDKYPELDFYIYRMFDVDGGKMMCPDDCRKYTKQLGLKHVKLIADAYQTFDKLLTLENMLRYVEGKTDRGNEREGFVFKQIDGPLHFKCINNKYLLAEKD